MTRLATSFVMLVALATAATSNARAQDFSRVKSGLLMGIYTAPSQGGMLVTGLIPGYSAENVLWEGDVLLRVAVSQNEVYRLRSRYELENAKLAIGADRPAAVEIWRPRVGLIYAFVEFTPINGPCAAAAPVAAGSKAAQFKLDNTGSARSMFQHQPAEQNNQGPQRPQPQRQPSQNNNNDASQFFK